MKSLLIDTLTQTANDYRMMAQGNCTLGGFCLAMANRCERMIAAMTLPAIEPTTEHNNEMETASV